MTIYEAIATGKKYKRPHHKEGWITSPPRPHKDCERLAHEVPCSGMEVDQDNKSRPWVWLKREDYIATDWIVEKSEEDFKDEAISILNNVLTKIGERV